MPTPIKDKPIDGSQATSFDLKDFAPTGKEGKKLVETFKKAELPFDFDDFSPTGKEGKKLVEIFNRATHPKQKKGKAASYRKTEKETNKSVQSTKKVEQSTVGNSKQKVVDIARKELAKNVREDKPNWDKAGHISKYIHSVKNDDVGYGKRGPEPWCASFVSYVFQKAGIPIGEKNKFGKPGGFNSCKNMANWFKQKGKFLPKSTVPKPGDVIFFSPTHVGIVERVDQNGKIHTIEGNLGKAPDGVKRRIISPNRRDIKGYGRM